VFKELLDRHADAAVIVFLIPLPEWVRLRENGLIPSQVSPKLVVLDISTSAPRGEYQEYFASGIVMVLISARVDPASSKTKHAWFDANYQIFTIENIESLADTSANH